MVVGLDSNIFIYHFQRHPEFGPVAKKVIKAIAKKQDQGVTSIISLLELLSLDDDDVLINSLKMSYLGLSNIKTLNVDQEISLEAARIRRTYRFRTSDSIQLATALIYKADKFITNDQKLKKFTELKIELLSEESV